MTNETDRIQNAIRHIQTAVDIDPWAMEIAVEAMQKQIPLKPLPKELAERQPFGNNPVYIIPCGSCREPLNFLFPYCPWCGQAIDWTGGEG